MLDILKQNDIVGLGLMLWANITIRIFQWNKHDHHLFVGEIKCGREGERKSGSDNNFRCKISYDK